MAILFTGCACSQRVVGDGAGNQTQLIIENGRGSARKVRILRMVVQLDMVAASTALNPAVVAYRGTGTPTVLGARLTSKGTFDTAQTSDAFVRIWTAITPDGANDSMLTASVSDMLWRKHGSRLRTAAEQTRGEDLLVLPENLETNAFYLYPGEFLVINVVPAVATTNTFSNNWCSNIVWQEETLSTYTISGTVTLGGSPVSGAEVSVLVADDAEMTNPFLHSVNTTDASGRWSADIQTGKYAYAYANSSASGTNYTAPGVPYMT